MLKKTVYPVLCMIILIPFIPASTSIPVQTSGDSPAKAAQEKPDITQTIKEIESQYKNKKNRDIDKIVASYEYLGKVFSEGSPSDQSSIIKTLKKAFIYHPTLADKEFQIKAADVLSRMGKNGLKTLLSSVESKRLKPRERSDKNEVLVCQEVKCAIIVAIGSFAEPKNSKKLFKLLWSSEDRIIVATSKALAEYRDIDLRYRKPIVEELIKRLAGLHVDENPPRPPGMDRRPKPGVDRTLAKAAVNEALKKLTGENLWNHVNWEKWFKDNKRKKEWDA